MDLETQDKYITIIKDDFTGLINMLKAIQENITEYPVYTQLEFIKPLKHIIVEALKDSSNPEDSFLNNYDGGDKIEL